MSEESPKRKRSLVSLWLLVALTVAPVAASYLAFYFWQPAEQVNYGELLEPRALPRGEWREIDGTPFRWEELKGKWVLAVADSGRCDAYCQQKLVYLRQVRLAQGKETGRVERVWLITDGARPDPGLLEEHEGARLVHAAGSDLLRSFPAEGALADHIYVVDPLGNLMMRYPRDPDPRRMLKDLARLLRHSKWR